MNLSLHSPNDLNCGMWDSGCNRQSNILFVSQEPSADLVQEAITLGLCAVESKLDLMATVISTSV